MVTARNTRDDVIEAAGRLFASRGYHGTSMRDVGRELGLHGSSLYSHVTSKEDLLVEVVERGAERFQFSAERADSTATDPVARLQALISGHIDVVLDHPDEVKTFLDEARSLESEPRKRVLDARDRYEQSFRDTITAGSTCGAFSPDLDPKLTAIFVLSILNAIEGWFHDGPMNRSALKSEITAFVEKSLR